MPHIKSNNPKRRWWWKTVWCSSCNADTARVFVVWKTSALRALWVVCCISELAVRY